MGRVAGRCALHRRLPASIRQVHHRRREPRPPLRRHFVHTGNTNFGVQNLVYDEDSKLWYLGVYRGSKPEFPNRTM